MLSLLKQYRFIKEYRIVDIEGKKSFVVDLYLTGKRTEDIPVINFYSVPSRRRYISWKDIKPVAAGRGIGIISTNQGLMATHQAKKKQFGGELIAEIY